MMSKKTLTRAQKSMNILGWFHFAWFILALVFIALIVLVGIDRFGTEFQKTSNPMFDSLRVFDGNVAGWSVIFVLAIGMFIELFLWWSCRRKARHPEKIWITLIISGAQILLSVFSMLRKGLANVIWLDSGYTLALNVVTFSLALWMRMEEKRRQYS